MNALICQAIREMRVLSFNYDGFLRIVEPHAYGITTKGNEALRCYQTGGGSSSGSVPGWHIMKISKMLNLSLLTEKFDSSRPGYKRGDRGLNVIYCEL